MSASATLTMLVSSTAMIVPIITEPAISHVCGRSRSSTAARACGGGAGDGCSRGTVAVAMSVRLYVRGHGHPGTQRTVRAATANDLNTYGNSLHDFGEVAGGIVRGQQRELRAGGGTDAEHLSVHGAAFVSVDVDLSDL